MLESYDWSMMYYVAHDTYSYFHIGNCIYLLEISFSFQVAGNIVTHFDFLGYWNSEILIGLNTS